MEFLYELIFEIILEGIFQVTIKNPKAKTWFKTVFFLVLTELIAVLMLICGISVIRSGNTEGGIVILIMCVCLAAGFAVAAFCGHKREWKQTNDEAV